MRTRFRDLGRPRSIAAQKMVRHRRLTWPEASHVSNASTVPPGKSGQIFWYEHDTSTRTVLPVLTGRPQSTGATLFRHRNHRRSRRHRRLFAYAKVGLACVHAGAASSLSRRHIAGEIAKMSTVMKPDFKNSSVARSCARLHWRKPRRCWRREAGRSPLSVPGSWKQSHHVAIGQA